MKKYKKLTSIMLSVMMIASLLPVTTMAEEIDTMPEADLAIEEQADAVEAEMETVIEDVAEEEPEADTIEISEESEVVENDAVSLGACGLFLEAFYVADTHQLIIQKTSGSSDTDSGKMYNYDSRSSTPWYSYQITSVVIRDGVETIGDKAFHSCTSLSNVYMADTVKEIGNSAFYNCSSLKGISLPTSLEKIGYDAFYKSGIQGIIIPDSVTSIGENAFSQCKSLSEVKLPADLKELEAFVFGNCSSLRQITLPEGMTTLKNGAFVRSGLTSISLPDSLTSVGFATFSECTDLAQITFSNNFTSIGESAFSFCGLTSIAIPDSVTSIGNFAFGYCSKLSNVTLSKNIAVIGEETFEACTALTSITIPKSVTKIEKNAFSECTKLAEINLPGGLTDIGVDVFASCTSLKDIYIWNNSTEYFKSLISAGNSGVLNSGNRFYTTNDGVESDVTVHGNMADLSEATVAAIAPQPYIGSAIKPALTVKHNGSTLVKGTDYTVTYADNVNIGTATVTITGIGRCVGTITTTFEIKEAKPDAPELPTLTNVSNGVKVSWKEVKGADKYRVLRRASSSSEWVAIGETDKTTFTDKTPTKGKTYAYTICALTSADSSDYNEIGKGIRVLGAITPTLANTSTGVSVKWTKAAGATGYYVYRKSGSGSYARIKTITSATTVSFTDTSVKANNGTTYTYAVKAYYSDFTSALLSKDICRLAGKSISTLTNVATRKMVVKWTKDAKVTGYQVQYSKSSTFASGNTTSTITSNSTVSKTIGSLTKGSTYYVRMRTYKTVSGVKYYSAWSAKKYVKIAK